ncbi:hypothetical protein [Actinomadura mexicana]|uniref:Uncharacterized protein n=1 Tax=Actinomadura mexicana TaxID=134959 RepID=A0A238UTN0_9ACTN|nr:hypothetical protein [Actinomadura mexicana]SNR25462.1 hypothetical protein SAMN06265355_101405 [Actinomadura mexicana]
MGKKDKVDRPHVNEGNAPTGRSYSVIPHGSSSGSSGTSGTSTSGTSTGLDPKVVKALEDAANVIRED